MTGEREDGGKTCWEQGWEECVRKVTEHLE